MGVPFVVFCDGYAKNFEGGNVWDLCDVGTYGGVAVLFFAYVKVVAFGKG